MLHVHLASGEMFSGPIKFDLPEPLAEPHLVHGFFPDEMFERVKNAVKKMGLGPDGNLQYHTMLGRWEAHITFDEDIEQFCLNKAREIYRDSSLVKAYFFLARYQIVDGCIPHLWEHTDQNGTQTTIDVAIENTAEWGIKVEGVEYSQSPNDAIVFAGQQHIHGRPPYPTDRTDLYTTVMFMHFTQPDHWFQEMGAIKGMQQYGVDGDFRFFNRERYVAMPDRPINQPVCKCHNYDGALNLYNMLEGGVEDPPEVVDMTLEGYEELAPGIMKFSFPKASAKILRGLTQNAMYKLWIPASVSRDNKSVVDYRARNCFTYFIDHKQNECHPQDPIRRLYASLEIGVRPAIAKYKTRYGLHDVVSKQWSLIRYEKNNMFENHYDDSPIFPRTISLSFFLNDDFTGGELVFPEFDLKITPVAGDMVIFPSNHPYLHRVNPVQIGIRYAAVRWYTHYESFDFKGV